MPAKSKAQFRYMKAIAEGSIKPEDGGLTKAQAAEYISTMDSLKGLPEKVKKKKKKK